MRSIGHHRLKSIAASLMAQERPGHILQVTALVHEALLKIRRLQSQVVSRVLFYHITALDLYRVTKSERHEFVAIAKGNLASIYLDRKQYSMAEKILREAVDIYLAAVPADHVDLAIARVKLGRVLLRQSRLTEAEKQSRSGLAVLEVKMSPTSHWIASARKDLAAMAKLSSERK